MGWNHQLVIHIFFVRKLAQKAPRMENEFANSNFWHLESLEWLDLLKLHTRGLAIPCLMFFCLMRVLDITPKC